MTFLNGILLGFTALGSVPIIIHLLNRRRFRIVVWAAMRFLLATLDKNQRRLQIRDLIIMALRACALVFLALALARPTFAPGGFSWLGPEGDTAAVVVLDNSMSMGYRAGAEMRYDVAKRAAKAVVEGLPKGSEAALVLMSDVAVEEVPKPSRDLLFVAAEITRSPLSDGGTDVLEGLRAAWEILKHAEAAGREMYLITDMQSRGWPAPDEPEWRALLEEMRAARPPASIYLIDVSGGGGTENLCIEDLGTDDEIVTTDNAVAFDVTIRNHGQLPADDVVVELYVGAPGTGGSGSSGSGGSDLHGMRKAATQSLETLEPRTAQTVTLEARALRGGEHRIEARIPVDRLAADNRRCMALDVTGRIRVLLIDGDPAEEGDEFGGETDFLKAALSPKDYESPDWQSPIEAEDTTVHGLKGKRLTDYQAVILANVADVSQGVASKLKYFVMVEGRGLVVFVGDNVSPGRYNELFCREGPAGDAPPAGGGVGGARGGLLPGRLGRRLIENLEDEDEGFGLVTDDLSHPIMSFSSRGGVSGGAGARASSGGAGIRRTFAELLSKVRFQKARLIELGESAGPAGPVEPPAGEPAPGDMAAVSRTAEDVAVVARFTGGEPAMVEKKLGRGTVLLAAFTADKEWTDFPLRPAYVPVVKRAVQHVTLGRRPQKNIDVNGRIVDFLAARDAETLVTVRDPRGGARQVTATLSRDGGLALAEYTRCHFAGFYELIRSPSPDGEERPASYFAANPHRIESDLEAFGEEDLSARYPNFEFDWVEGTDDIRQALKAERAGREMWPYLFALALMCLAAETVLVLLWAPREA